MDSAQRPKSGPLEGCKQAIGVIGFFARTLSTSVEVFLRSGFGERYFGMQAAAVIPLALAFTMFWKDEDPIGLFVFLGAYVFMCAGRRIEGAIRRKRGDIAHTYYNGRPGILSWRIFRRLSERTAKRLVEPMLVCVTGALLNAVSRPLGFYLIVAGVGMIVSTGFSEAYLHVRMMDVRDAYIEQKQVAEKFRGNFE